MEPTADGLVEVTSESLPSAPSINEVVASVSGNGHAAPATDGDAFNLHLLHALQSVRLGDFSARLPGDATGVNGKIADTFNEIVASNQRMAQQLEYVGQVVGREGKTWQRVKLTLSDGAWGEMEGSVNALIDDLLWPTNAVTDAINAMVDQLRSFASEVTRVAREVGTEGKLGGQAIVPGVAGTWKDLTDSVNAMCGNLTAQVRNIAQVTTAVARGDLSRKITVDVSGEILELKDTNNTMLDQLHAFASEVTRVAREVGTEGRLGGQAVVPGVAG